MAAYTVGFIFDSTLGKVLLIHKTRPTWQNGRMNGVGGKIEKEETSPACMVREAQEECGLATKEEDWVFVGEIDQPAGAVDVYALCWQGSMEEAATTTDEVVEWCDAFTLPGACIPSVTWMIPLARDRLKGGTGLERFLAHYNA